MPLAQFESLFPALLWKVGAAPRALDFQTTLPALFTIGSAAWMSLSLFLGMARCFVCEMAIAGFGYQVVSVMELLETIRFILQSLRMRPLALSIYPNSK